MKINSRNRKAKSNNNCTNEMTKARFPPSVVVRHHFIPLILCCVIITDMMTVYDNILCREPSSFFLVHAHSSSTVPTKQSSLLQQEKNQPQHQQEQHVPSTSQIIQKQQHLGRREQQQEQPSPAMEVRHSDRHLAHALTLVRQWDLHHNHHQHQHQQPPVNHQQDDSDTDVATDEETSTASNKVHSTSNNIHDRVKDDDWLLSYHVIMPDIKPKNDNKHGKNKYNDHENKTGKDYVYHDFSKNHGRSRRGQQIRLSLSDHHDQYNEINPTEQQEEYQKLSSRALSSLSENPIPRFGWTPSEYPNPISQPLSCHVASFMDDDVDVDKQSNLANHHPSKNKRLLLCDPDSILVYASRKKVADALLNFTAYYGQPTPYHPTSTNNTNQQQNQNNNITEAESRKLMYEQQTQTQTKAQTIEIKEGHNSFKNKSYNNNDTTNTKWWVSLPAAKTLFYENMTNLLEVVGFSRNLSTSSSTNMNLNKVFASLSFKNFFESERILLSTSTVTTNTIKSEKIDSLYSKSLSLDGTFFGDSNIRRRLPSIEIGVAITRKMNLSQLIRTDTYYTYEQDDDLVNDAAQFFARYLHKSWWSTNEFSSSSNKNKYNYKLNIVDNQTIHRANPSNDDDKNTDDDNQEWTSNKTNLKNKNHLNQYENREVGGILIFLSIEDRICFISAGPIVSSVLPWWRLERVITDMKPNLHRGSYDEALLGAIEDLAAMIESGSPTSSERMIYFLSRYGVVLAFAIFTFIFAAWGEFRENRNRWEYIEARTSMTKFEKDKARGLQKQFRDLMCPICLENFQFGDEKGTESRFGQILESDSSCDDPDNETTTGSTSLTLKRVDSYGIPLLGNDGLPLKMLRCGHVFDQTCWKLWAHSGQGNPCKCPVCRQDVGTCIQVLSHEQSQGPETPRMTNTTRQQRNNATSIAASTSSTPLSVSTGNRANYNSILQSDHQTNEGYDFMVVIDVESNQ